MGREMYVLHDNGRKLFDSARTCTPMQRFVYVMAKNHHQDDPQSAQPGGMNEAKQFNQATQKF